MVLLYNIFRALILVAAVAAVAFDVFLYDSYRKQRMETEAIDKQQQVQAQVNTNQFKYQQDQIDRLSKELEDAQQQLRDQKNEDENIRISLVDIKAEADVIKGDMTGWQKDYVSVLAQLEKKVDDYEDEIKDLKGDLDSFEKIVRPPDSAPSETPAQAVKPPDGSQPAS